MVPPDPMVRPSDKRPVLWLLCPAFARCVPFGRSVIQFLD